MVARSLLSPLLVIVGETASGKTSLAIKLAQKFNGEIICADSWTVRQGVDIGTAKPSPKERTMVPHHLLDLVEPCEDFTAAVFKQLANDAIDDITSRGKLPIMVGGTGLYIDGVLYDFGFLPAGDSYERKILNKMSTADLLLRISEKGIKLGDVDIRNKRRLIRLIETNGAMPTKKELRPRSLILGLMGERQTTENRITKRVDAMIKAGLEAEVRGLAKRYGWNCEALKGIGYAQWRDYFEGSETRGEVRQKIIKVSLDLAKRQRTWLKRNKSIQWIPTPVKWINVVDAVTTFLVP